MQPRLGPLRPKQVVVAVFVAATLLFGKPIINGDGVQYYAYVRSTIVDHDLLLGDEFREALPRFRSLAPPPLKTSRGFDDAYAPVGAAVVWMAPVLVSHVGLALLNRVGARLATDGYSDVYMFTASLVSWSAMLFGLLLCFDLARNWFSERAAAIGVLGGWLATPLFANAYELPTFAHAIDFGFVSFLVWLIAKRSAGAHAPTWFVIGLLLGFCVAIRQQNVTLALFPLVLWIRMWRGVGWERRRDAVLCAAAVAVGALAGFLPQIAMNVSLFGRPFAFHEQYVPRIDWPPHFWRDLFSWNNGLFSWTPFAAIAVAGLMVAARRRGCREFAITALAVSAANIFLIGVLPYGPVLIGQRYLINCTPFFIVGAGAIADAIGAGLSARRFAAAIAILALFVVWNVNLDTLVVYNLIDRSGSFSFGELVHKQITVAPRHWIDHVAGLSINQPCFSPLHSLWMGLRGAGRELVKGAAAVAAILAAALLTTRIADAIIAGGDGREMRRRLTRRVAPVAVALQIAVAGVWIWFGAPFHVFR